MSTDRSLSTSDLAGSDRERTEASPAVDEPGEPKASFADESREEPVNAAPSSAEPDASAGQPDGSPSTGQRGNAPLFSDADLDEFRGHWQEIQTGFVDEPRQAVERADTLVAELMKRLAQTFAKEREGLEAQWGEGENVSTEELRVALQRYRSFFERLLTT